MRVGGGSRGGVVRDDDLGVVSEDAYVEIRWVSSLS